MDNNTIIQITAIISPFLASFLTYKFAIKSKFKDVDIEKERHLHTTLSYLLTIWHDLKTLKSLTYILKDKSEDLLFPKRLFSEIILNEKLLNQDKFDGLKHSIEGVKKYDAITYFHLEGFGENLKDIKTRFIFPFLKVENIKDSLIDISAGKLIDQSIEEYEAVIIKIASLINNRTKKILINKITDSKKEDAKSVINELNINYYQNIMSGIPENEVRPSYDEILKEFKPEELQKISELQIDIFKNNGMQKILKIVSENPDISVEEMITLYNQNKEN
ncbi:MAG: hypothetical protein EVB11_11515 [Winogradskyella sp.]|nr:MAG: hypothetical protein EVB11_11515 [Winogradskyella sp.]